MVKTLLPNVLFRKQQIPKSISHFFETAACGKCYVCKMVEVFREVRRVLRRDGTCWVNLGDSYAGANNGYSGDNRPSNANSLSHNGGQRTMSQRNTLVSGLKSKDLCGIPWRVAFALQADGWWLRQDIVWAKPNPMPESVTDRCTKSHEYIFLLTKSARYFYDAEAVKERAETEPHNSGYVNGKEYSVGPMDRGGHSQREDPERVWAQDGTRNRRSVWAVPEDEYDQFKQFLEWKRQHSGDRKDLWTVPSFAYPGAHFATYPPDLIKPCILAGTSARGCCPKCGAPWERVVERGELKASPGRESSTHGAKNSGNQDNGWSDDNFKPGFTYEYKTLGWQPTCSCRWFKLKTGVPQPTLDMIRSSIKLGAWRNGFATSADSGSPDVEAVKERYDSALKNVTTNGENRLEYEQELSLKD